MEDQPEKTGGDPTSQEAEKRASKPYSAELRATVMAALLSGQSVSQIAREYHLPKGTVTSWKTRKTGLKNATQKSDIGDLVLKYLRTNLEALTSQAEMFKKHAWLSKQSASEVAVLHGVMTDKAIRLLEALSGESKDK
jgi:transposase-like protein